MDTSLLDPALTATMSTTRRLRPRKSTGVIVPESPREPIHDDDNRNKRHAVTGEVERWYEGQKPLWVAVLDATGRVYQPVFVGTTPLEIMWEVDET
jgi:hypothetical protein